MPIVDTGDKPLTGPRKRPRDTPKSEPVKRKPGRPSKFLIPETAPRISDLTVIGKFVRGFAADANGETVTRPDGSPLPVIVREYTAKDGSVQRSVIHVGDIEATGRYLAYEITSGRKVGNPDWSAYVTIKATDRTGREWIKDIAAGALRATVTNATWLDPLGIAFNEQSNYVRKFIRILAEQEPVNYVIQGQGAFIFDDESPSSQLSKRLTFASKSVVFDATGVLPYRTDVGDIPDTVNYYDLTPVSEITDAEIKHGCEMFALSYTECPKYPSIPAAMNGQLFAGSLAAVIPSCFSAILMTGTRGSGKSYYAARYDEIQSRYSDRSRGARPMFLPPAVNLGDQRGTVKGPGYRYVSFGGYSITFDDILKEGATEFDVKKGSQTLSDAIRSYEAGGGSLGHVDHARNKVTGTQTPALHSSVRALSEIPIEGESTKERMIVLPHITAKYGRPGAAFDTNVAGIVDSPESREAMHRAYSAYVQWLLPLADADLYDFIEKAKQEVSPWNVPSRTQQKYAAIITGHYAFARFAELHGVDLSAKVTSAIAALRALAHKQASSTVSVAEMFARDLRAAIINRKVAFPGAPTLNDDGSESGMYGLPYRVVETVDESGITHANQDMPFTFRELGLTVSRDNGGSPAPYPGARDYGFIMPPRADAGGKAGSPLTRTWYLAIKGDHFKELCRTVSRDGREYRPDDVIRSLRDDVHKGDKKTVLMPTSSRAVIIDAAWALTSKGDDE